MSDLSEEIKSAVTKAKIRAARELAASKATKQPQKPAQNMEAPQDVITLQDGTRMVFDPATGSYTSAELMAGNMQPGAAQSFQAGAAQGITLGWGDELAEMLGASPLAVERGRATMRAASRDNPLSYGAGAVGAALSTAPMVAKYVPAGMSMASKIGIGGATGAALGAAQGAGEALPGARARGAVMGGAIGGALGAAAPPVAAGIGTATRAVLNRLKGVDVAGIKAALGIGDDAAKVIKGFLANDDFVAAEAALKKAGPQGMLADSSPQAGQLLDTTVAAGGPAQRIAREAVDARSAAASTSLKGAMDRILGPLGGVEGVKTAAKNIATKTAEIRKQAYDRAYSSAINYADDAGRKIEEVLSRIPSSQMKGAIQAANDAMTARGVRNLQIMAEVAEDGTVTFREMPNVQQLDFLKRALGEAAAENVDRFGRPTGLGRDLSMLATDLRNAIADAVPSYSRAVKLGGDKIAEDNALQLGRDLLSVTTRREDVAAAARGMSAEAKLAAKKGLRIAFDEAMENVKAVASDLNSDARQALTVVKQFSSPANRTKAELILGAQDADALFREFDQAATQLALRSVTARNSATAARTAGKQAMDDIITGGPIEALKRGKITDWARGLVQVMTKTTPADDVERMQAIYGEVAKALTQIRGPQAEAALRAVNAAMSGAPVTQAQAQLVANTITTALAVSAYRSAAQAQTKAQSGQARLPQ